MAILLMALIAGLFLLINIVASIHFLCQSFAKNELLLIEDLVFFGLALVEIFERTQRCWSAFLSEDVAIAWSIGAWVRHLDCLLGLVVLELGTRW